MPRRTAKISPKQNVVGQILKSTDVLERFVPVLLIVSIGLAFLVGVLWQKVANLEGGGTTVANNQVANNNQAQGVTTGPALDIASLKQYAQDLGLNTGDFNSCLDSGKYEQKVKDDLDYGQSAGISGTPGFLVNGRLVDGGAQPYQVFKDILDYELSGGDWNTLTGTLAYLGDSNPNNGEVAKTTVSVNLTDTATTGSESAPITLVEFSDFECPFCASFFNKTFGQIKSDYIDTGKIRFAYKHFPLIFHPNAQKSAEASECAKEQGKFWEMHDRMFESHGA